MIFVDGRAGSGDLAPALSRLAPTTKTTLEFADASFGGRGPDGAVDIGIEIKKVGDALQCMRDGRFSGHQLPGMLKQYDHCWFICEGEFRPEPSTGILQTRHDTGLKKGWWGYPQGPRFMYAELDHWLTTIEMRAGFRVRRTVSRDDTVAQIISLYRWWTGKDYGAHISHLDFNTSWAKSEGVSLSPPRIHRVVAARLPGIGWGKAEAVAKYFGSVERMAAAEAAEWERIAGIGPGIARRIQEERGWRDQGG